MNVKKLATDMNVKKDEKKWIVKKYISSSKLKGVEKC
jgi:hypothetical protein